MTRWLCRLIVFCIGCLADIDHAGANELTEPLISAVQANDEAAVRALVKRGADVNWFRNGDGESSLHYAASRRAVKPALVKLLVELGGKLDLPDRQGIAPLSHATMNVQAHSPELDKAKILGPITKGDALRLDALLSCMHYRETPQVEAVVRYLVSDLKVNVNGADAAGVTPLMAAASVYFTNVARLLLDQGANLGARDAQGRTALQHALSHYELIVVGSDEEESTVDLSRSFAAMIALLLARGADASVVDAEERTTLVVYLTGDPIRYAPKLAVDIVRSLKKAGAVAGLRDKSGKAAVDYLPALTTALPKQTLAALRQILKQP